MGASLLALAKSIYYCYHHFTFYSLCIVLEHSPCAVQNLNVRRPNMSCLDSLRTDMLCRYVFKTFTSKRRYKRSLVCVDVAGRDTCLQLSFTSG